MNSLSRICSLLACFTIGTPIVAMAADVITPEVTNIQPANDWKFEITPYAWATGLKGDISPFRRLPSVSIEKDFSDVLEDLDGAIFLNAWGTNGEFGFLADIMYVNLSEAHGFGPIPLPIGHATTNLDVKVDASIFSGTFMGAYRVASNENFALDALGGVRFFHVWTDLKLNARINNTPLHADYRLKSSFGWADPLVGARLQYDFNDKLQLVTQADVGGFNVGSDLTVQAIATLKYAINDKTSLALGYKYMDIDYSRDGRVFDSTLHGPLIGLTFRF